MAAAAARWPRFFVLRPAVALLLLLLLLLLHATAASPTTESSAGNDTDLEYVDANIGADPRT
uniref:Uncharacterized protein n=1 Tax=Oryza meridionalis TaxID=40149 RepID=A0A0E0CHI8_9ORYZ